MDLRELFNKIILERGRLVADAPFDIRDKKMLDKAEAFTEVIEWFGTVPGAWVDVSARDNYHDPMERENCRAWAGNYKCAIARGCDRICYCDETIADDPRCPAVIFGRDK